MVKQNTAKFFDWGEAHGFDHRASTPTVPSPFQRDTTHTLATVWTMLFISLRVGIGVKKGARGSSMRTQKNCLN